MNEPTKVSPTTCREALLLTLLLSTGGYGATQLHQADQRAAEADMQHMREKLSDVRNEARDRYEDLMRACRPLAGLPIATTPPVR